MAVAALPYKPFSREAVLGELEAIANWWATIAVDEEQGGFFGEVDAFSKPVSGAPKGVILNTRILWFFSELALFNGDTRYITLATRAYEWICHNLVDHECGGLFWEVDSAGHLVQGKKQSYAQCFGIYALSRYYALTHNSEALVLAKTCFQLVEKHARDRENGGYIEACTREWGAIEDFRLSEKDLNCPKSMNTHLHVLEAYSALYRVHADDEVSEALQHIVDTFLERIMDGATGHLKLFFSQKWKDLSATVSFGHNIEASWLLHEAVEILADEKRKAQAESVILALAEKTLHQGMSDAGFLCDDADVSSGHRKNISFWWVQAEALVGFFNAYLLTGNSGYYHACETIWSFIQRYHKDDQGGEWYWTAKCHHAPAEPTYKAGFWKAPYHSGRAMMELCHRFDKLTPR